jgi:osmotically-inducible protein OsmY
MDRDARAQDLSSAVAEQLRSNPRLDAARMSATTVDGVVTLTGSVRSYSEKCYAERLVREVRGVVAVRNELEVRLSIGNFRTDEAIAHLTRQTLENHAGLTDPLPRVTVREGWVILDGVVPSELQKWTAERSLRDIAGIRGITNRIEVVPRLSADEARRSFLTAVLRRAALAVEGLRVRVYGNTMAVYGTVGSCVEHDDLMELAARTRGIAGVKDRVTVRPGS